MTLVSHEIAVWLTALHALILLALAGGAAAMLWRAERAQSYTWIVHSLCRWGDPGARGLPWGHAGQTLRARLILNAVLLNALDAGNTYLFYSWGSWGTKKELAHLHTARMHQSQCVSRGLRPESLLLSPGLFCLSTWHSVLCWLSRCRLQWSQHTCFPRYGSCRRFRIWTVPFAFPQDAAPWPQMAQVEWVCDEYHTRETGRYSVGRHWNAFERENDICPVCKRIWKNRGWIRKKSTDSLVTMCLGSPGCYLTLKLFCLHVFQWSFSFSNV